MKILIIDPLAFVKPYETESLTTRPMGGTEATVIRVANGLAKNHQVWVAQCLRKEDKVESASLAYISYKTMKKLTTENIDRVIILRGLGEVNSFKKIFPQAKIYLWMHDMLPSKLSLKDKIYKEWMTSRSNGIDYEIVAVSGSHKDSIEQFLSTNNQKLKVTYVYNPIDEDLKPNAAPVDLNKLVFFSSPHKGLNDILKLFQEAKKKLPNLKLFIANPGYQKLKKNSKLGFMIIKKINSFFWDGYPSVEKNLIEQPGIEIVGTLTHKEVLEHVRTACCVFYPQKAYPESFGLVFAEANAVGTPVLAHSFGAAPEILSTPEQVLDVSDTKEILNRLEKWCKGHRPKVEAKKEFRLSNVIKAWEKVLK